MRVRDRAAMKVCRGAALICLTACAGGVNEIVVLRAETSLTSDWRWKSSQVIQRWTTWPFVEDVKPVDLLNYALEIRWWWRRSCRCPRGSQGMRIGIRDVGILVDSATCRHSSTLAEIHRSAERTRNTMRRGLDVIRHRPAHRVAAPHRSVNIDRY